VSMRSLHTNIMSAYRDRVGVRSLVFNGVLVDFHQIG